MVIPCVIHYYFLSYRDKTIKIHSVCKTEWRMYMSKKKIMSIVLTLIVWAVMFYNYLPAINLQSNDFWLFSVVAIAVAVVINAWSIFKSIAFVRGDPERYSKMKLFKRIMLIPMALVVLYLGGSLLSSPILRAGAYHKLMDVKTSRFEDDIQEVNYNQIPILDKDVASKLAEREMGSMVDMVSQYEVSNYFTQINYQSKPVRVTPLEYGNIIKWITNRKTGIPAYIRIDMTTQDVELVKLPDGLKYSQSEHFGRNLNRYLRFCYPTYMFRGFNFEINDEGIPCWICPVEKRTIGLFGGTDIKGAVILNAITGEHTYYDVADVPQWVDKVYDAELLIQQYDYHGTLKNGYINSVFGQRDCLQTTEGYNYIAINDDVWVYTGVTSVSGDQSIVGFVLMNQRTKETKYYLISGAKEISAMSSAEGQVQHLGYTATFPLLLNIGGEPTYFLALKDSAGLVKKYAMVNIEKYQIVATGDTVAQCEKAYKGLMAGSGIDTVDTTKKQTVAGKIVLIKDIVVDGNTFYYIALEGNANLFEVEVKNQLTVLKKKEGDMVTIEYVPSMVDGIHTVISMK